MEPRKVTPKEVEELMAFCKKKDVFFIDLRLELADHLAHSIDEYWMENPKSTFPNALMTVYKRFGIFGFLDVVTAHQNRMTKRYVKQLWQTVLVILAWPRILGFALITLGLFQSMSQHFIMRQVTEWLFVVVVVVGTIMNTFQYFRNRKILNGEITVLMNSSIHSIIWFGYLFVQVIFRPKFWSTESLMSERAPLLLTLLLSSSILFFTASYIIQIKSKKLLQELKLQLS